MEVESLATEEQEKDGLRATAEDMEGQGTPNEAEIAAQMWAGGIATKISGGELGIARSKVDSVIRLLDEGNTIPPS